MPIEFPCPDCGRLLRTADETAGRSARCPACGSVTTVPERVETPDRDAGPFGSGESPFTGAEPAAEPDDFANPYQAPADHTAGSPFYSAVPPSERVRLPAISMIIMASLGLAMHLGIVVLYTILLIAFLSDAHVGADDRASAAVGFSIVIGYGVIGLGLMILALVGAVKMKNLESYGLAMTSAILMVIPALSPCCFIGIPFGIWALVVLADAQVRAAFH